MTDVVNIAVEYDPASLGCIVLGDYGKRRQYCRVNTDIPWHHRQYSDTYAERALFRRIPTLTSPTNLI